MSEQPPATKRAAPRRRNIGRVLGNIAVAIVILAVMAGAFALSYTPVRDIARDAGVASPVVRIYPGILDAVFLICCACALMLRNARWWTRLYAWLSVLVTGALIGAAGVYHATGLRLPRRTLDGTVWALPWALVLLGFSLWISTLQHTKSDRDPQTPEPDDRTSGPDDRAAPDAPVLALEASPAARAALPAPQEQGLGQAAEVAEVAEVAATQPVKVAGRPPQAGGLAEVGLGRPALAREAAQAEEAAEADQAVTADAAQEAQEASTSAEAPVVAGAPVAAEVPTVAEAPAAEESAEARQAEEASRANEPEETGTGLAQGPREAPVAALGQEAEATAGTELGEGTGEGTGTEPSGEAGGAAEPTGEVAEAVSVAAAGDPADTKDVAQAEEPVDPEDAAAAEEPTAAGEGLGDHEVTEADETRETANAEAATLASAAPASTAEADTPAYGFPVVTEQDVDRELPRMPTLLGAPVPADMEDVATVDPAATDSAATDPAATDSAAVDPAAKGKPPAASAELPVTEAELAHEDQPDQEPTPPAPSPPPQTPEPARFERVRSTPRRPAE